MTCCSTSERFRWLHRRFRRDRHPTDFAQLRLLVQSARPDVWRRWFAFAATDVEPAKPVASFGAWYGREGSQIPIEEYLETKCLCIPGIERLRVIDRLREREQDERGGSSGFRHQRPRLRQFARTGAGGDLLLYAQSAEDDVERGR